MTEDQFSEIRTMVAGLAGTSGRQGLIDFLVDLEDGEGAYEKAGQALQQLERVGPGTWLEDLVEVAMNTRAENVLSRVSRWEIDSLSYGLDEPERNRFIQLLRRHLHGEDSTKRVRAARALMAFGYRFDNLEEDVTLLLEGSSVSDQEFLLLTQVAARFGILSKHDLELRLAELVSRFHAPTHTLTHLISFYGDPLFLEYLRRQVALDRREGLMALIALADRFPHNSNLLSEVAEVFLAAPRRDTVGLEHFATRMFDDARLASLFLTEALTALETGRTGLSEQGHLRRCNLPQHLRFFSEEGSKVVEPHLELLRELIETSTGYQGNWPTHESYRKITALVIASRLGIPQLRDWVKSGIATETTRSLVARMAQDCCLWNIPDFIGGLAQRLQEPGEENPMWLVSDESGVVGHEETIRILLDSDGRGQLTNSDVLTTYVEGLAMCSFNMGSAAPLTEAMNDVARPHHTRGGAAHGIRRAEAMEPAPDIDWEAVCQYIRDEQNSEFTRHELLIALANNSQTMACDILKELPDQVRTRTRVNLAMILANWDTGEVLRSLARYLRPPPTPYSHSFEDQYASLCLIHLYERKLVDGTNICRYLSQGLRFEIDNFLIRCKAIYPGDEDLFEALVEETLARNDSWRAHPALWHAMARLRSTWLLEQRTQNHALHSTDRSVRAYLDALIDQKEQLNIAPDDLFRLVIPFLRESSRAVAWHAAFAASIICPEAISAHYASTMPSDDRDIRCQLECAVWLPEEVWQEASDHAKRAHWLTTQDYARTLSKVRIAHSVAMDCWESFLSSDRELEGWKYVQALLQSPSELVLMAIQNWEPLDLREGYIRRWLLEEIPKKLKKGREDLWRHSRLPGEEPFPSGF